MNDLKFNKRTRLWTSLLVIVTLGLGGLSAWRYLRLRQVPALFETAAEAAKQGDYSTAVMGIRRILAVHPGHLESHRFMAELTRSFQLPESVEWRRRILEMEPQNPRNLIDLILAILSTKSPKQARQALLEHFSDYPPTAELFALKATVEFAAMDIESANSDFQTALEMDPGNESFRLNFAKTQLLSTDPAEVRSAMETLTVLSEHSSVRIPAITALLPHLKRGPDPQNRARLLAEFVLNSREATLKDKLSTLDAMCLEESLFTEGLWNRLAGLCEHPISMNVLLTWMNRNGFKDQALALKSRFPERAVRKAPLAITVAESHILGRDWKELRRWIGAVQWNKFKYVLRFIESELALREEAAEASSRARVFLRQSLIEASKLPDGLQHLLMLSRQWDWRMKEMSVLEALSDNRPKDAKLLQELFSVYRKENDSMGMYKTMLKALALSPGDSVIKNNAASLGLLLGRQPNRSHRLALENYQSFPDHPAYAATYAFSLYVQGAGQEALNVMNAFDEETKRSEPFAFYYSLILASTGKNEASIEIAKSLHLENYLMEERSLMQRAWN